jgi:signal transduction histidine kinase
VSGERNWQKRIKRKIPSLRGIDCEEIVKQALQRLAEGQFSMVLRVVVFGEVNRTSFFHPCFKTSNTFRTRIRANDVQAYSLFRPRPTGRTVGSRTTQSTTLQTLLALPSTLGIEVYSVLRVNMAPLPNSKPRLLFVDDEESIRLTLPPVLQEKGFEVQVASNVPEALVEINSSRFDALITDLNIAEQGDGFLVVSAMRHLQPHCVNLILTGYPAVETAVQAIRSQVDDYLTKPSDVDSLVTTINQKLQSRGDRLPATVQAGVAVETMEQKISEATKLPSKRRTANLERIRELTGSLLQLRDEERRKIARELHDSLGQLLTAVSIDLSLVEREIPSLTPKGANAVHEAADLVQQIIKEVRTISHLLHPPLLDEAGLASAIRCYLEGYAERSNLAVDVQIPADFGRLPADMETAIFRIVQEALTNVYRHSGSATATVRIARISQLVQVEVQDHGNGIPPERLSALKANGNFGVGIRGMRERVKQFGGSLEIKSNSQGTLLMASLPVAESFTQAAKKFSAA